MTVARRSFQYLKRRGWEDVWRATSYPVNLVLGDVVRFRWEGETYTYRPTEHMTVKSLAGLRALQLDAVRWEAGP